MIVLIVISVILLGYLYQKWHYSYWTRRGVYQKEPEFFYGNLKDVLKGKVSLNYQYKLLYDNLKSQGVKYGGHYELMKPSFIPVDLDIVKSVIQKDFSSFVNRGNYANEKHDPLSGHLVFLENEKWRKLRAKLTPTFTTGNILIFLYYCTYY
ncbi:hypothetical protein C4B38_000406 [Diabrotica virgifera virgifera]|uniref:Cytochrome P450 6a22-like n=1 Tax=Diabrotica virgifera virgifera TaxID=50390 RepID=A0A6P7H8D5_DIAVI|nr:hypothetical protein C4B38_000334 [Diabrotica virgifera virgifera]KAI2474340.1 hypothetical protein C4B38_000406 [Diabrotica virgifera virgifera]